MAFSPDSVGLSGERVTGYYEEPRPSGCPHKGLDISSSQKPKDFVSGVWGRITNPVGGQWGTITLQPFNSSTATIQFLHCSEIAVSTGQIVTPWTRLGKTGNVAPSSVGVIAIHLHIQVVEPGPPKHSCWLRNFVDPQTWAYVDPLIGVWEVKDSAPTELPGVGPVTLTWDGKYSVNVTQQLGALSFGWQFNEYDWTGGNPPRACTLQVEETWQSTFSSARPDGYEITSTPTGCKPGIANCIGVRCNGGGPVEPMFFKLLSQTQLLVSAPDGTRAEVMNRIQEPPPKRRFAQKRRRIAGHRGKLVKLKAKDSPTLWTRDKWIFIRSSYAPRKDLLPSEEKGID